jgi:hypothetical protein
VIQRIVAEVFTLVFSITALNLLVSVFLNFALEDTGPGRLIEACSLQDMCRIDPVIVSSAHNMFLEIGAELVLVDRYL